MLPAFLPKRFVSEEKIRKIQITENRPRVYKTFIMLNSAEHEILNAHKYKNIKKFGVFYVQISLECYFSCS